jgi:hypothetical protein
MPAFLGTDNPKERYVTQKRVTCWISYVTDVRDGLLPAAPDRLDENRSRRKVGPDAQSETSAGRKTYDTFIRLPPKSITPARQIPITVRAEGSGVGIVEGVLQTPLVPTSAGGLKADHVPSKFVLKLPFVPEIEMAAGPSPTGRMPDSASLGSL